MDDPGPKSATVLALLIGMGVAIAFKAFQINTGNLIVLAQALTVLGNPLLAGAMLWLATRRDLVDDQAIPLWIKLLASAGFLVVLLLSVRTAIRLYLQLTL
jgi:Mn2+/Fe2+ NRAMP family transporter